MKKVFTITDKNMITEILSEIEYGSLALSVDNKPYCVPLNFVQLNETIYFHGAKKGKKLDFIKENSLASFLVVEAFSVLPSFFATSDNLACPATQLFKSVIIDGVIHMVDDYNEKAQALEALMQKLQKEGKYIPLDDKIYEKAINATALFKLVPDEISCKFKLGQNFNEERLKRVSQHLEERGTKKDLETLELIMKFRK